LRLHYHSIVMTNQRKTDVVVIGAGPIGLELAVALKREEIDYLQFDAQQIGYTISWFPPQTRFFSSNDRIAIAGVPLQTPDQNKSTREEYLAYLRGVVQLYDLKINTYEPVVGIERHDSGFAIKSRNGGNDYLTKCRRIVLATGGTAKARKLGVHGENLPHVFTRLDDPHVFFRKRLLIVGGKNSAIETALRCHHAGANVSISYRRAELDARSVKYWLMPEISGLLRSGSIEGYFSSTVEQITPSHVSLRTRESSSEVPFDFVMMAIGYEADMSLCRLAGVKLNGECERPAFDAQTMETNVPGVYLAGTVTGGTQDKYAVFIENGHVHIDRIIAALSGRAEKTDSPVYEQPES
jgi:thioredoxin reductase (NADPH)